jgi:ABC-type multidrug transport system ATPase subunit
MFCDGSNVYKKYKTGYVILGPPGIGKTTFVKGQIGKKKNWIDQDELFSELGVK